MAAGDNFDSATHGVGGPLNVAPVPSGYEALNRVIAAAEKLGWPHNKDYNSGTQDEVFYYQVNQKSGLGFQQKKPISTQPVTGAI